jgi:hypothetical protein
MVGTVKIISYAVDGVALEAACTVRGGGAARVSPPALRRAALIVTEAPDGPARRDAKGIAAVARGLPRWAWR